MDEPIASAFLTLKDVDGDSFADAYGMIEFVVSSLCGEHIFLLDSSRVLETDKKIFVRLLEQSGKTTDLKTALFVIMRMMKARYGKDVILLVDEYDVPLAKASDNGYNFISNSISSKKYQDYFGFKEAEVRKLLRTVGLQEALLEMKKWYDGYIFGEEEIYCPWDVINHVDALMTDPGAEPGNYWADTSHNHIIQRFIEHPCINVNAKFEILLAGGVIQEPIREDLTYDIAHSTEDNLWSILYLTGYLTQVLPGSLPQGMNLTKGNTALRIPNEEVKSVFGDTVKKWFEDKIAARFLVRAMK